MLNRKVMMKDGIARTRHRIDRITHIIDDQTTFEVVSNDDNGGSVYVWQVSNEYDSTIDIDRAYEILSNLDSMAEYVDPVDEVLPLLPDDIAEQVTELFHPWEAGVAYEVGDRRKHSGKLYKCVQAHTSQEGWEPPDAPALWTRTGEDPDDPTGIPEWVQPTGAQDAYSAGDKVTHVGRTWLSLVNGNVWEPGAPGTEGIWAEVAPE